MLLLLACAPAAGAKGGATRFPGKTTSWRHADAAARMWAESGDHRFSFSELGDSLPSGAAQCATLQDSIDCHWRSGRCSANREVVAGACVASGCGLLSCSCEAADRTELLPWVILNVSAAASVAEVRAAYSAAVKALAPTLNLGCLEAARLASLAARRARDTMLVLMPYLEHTPHGVQPAISSRRDYSTAIGGEPTPLARHAWRATQRLASGTVAASREMWREISAAWRAARRHAGPWRTWFWQGAKRLARSSAAQMICALLLLVPVQVSPRPSLRRHRTFPDIFCMAKPWPLTSWRSASLDVSPPRTQVYVLGWAAGA